MTNKTEELRRIRIDREVEKEAVRSLKEKAKDNSKPIKIDDSGLQTLITGYQARLKGTLQEILEKVRETFQFHNIFFNITLVKRLGEFANGDCRHNTR